MEQHHQEPATVDELSETAETLHYQLLVDRLLRDGTSQTSRELAKHLVDRIRAYLDAMQPWIPKPAASLLQQIECEAGQARRYPYWPPRVRAAVELVTPASHPWTIPDTVLKDLSKPDHQVQCFLLHSSMLVAPVAYAARAEPSSPAAWIPAERAVDPKHSPKCCICKQLKRLLDHRIAPQMIRFNRFLEN